MGKVRQYLNFPQELYMQISKYLQSKVQRGRASSFRHVQPIRKIWLNIRG